VLARYEHLESIPARAVEWDSDVRRAVRGADKLAARLAEETDHALLFRLLATLRVDPSLVPEVVDLAWRGPTPGFVDMGTYLRDPALAEQAAALGALR
jgi:hypothetical protein